MLYYFFFHPNLPLEDDRMKMFQKDNLQTLEEEQFITKRFSLTELYFSFNRKRPLL